MNSNHQVKGKLGTNWCLLFVINPILGGTQQSFIWVVYMGGVGAPYALMSDLLPFQGIIEFSG